jgi:hypothetical protein
MNPTVQRLVLVIALAGTVHAESKSSNDGAIILAIASLATCYVILISVLIAAGVAIRTAFGGKAARKAVKRRYASLPSEQQSSIAELSETIATTLDVSTPGGGKWKKAWRNWSEQDDTRGLKLKSKVTGYSPYDFVEDTFRLAEIAMCEEDFAMKKVKEKGEKTKEAIHEAAVMWAIYWPEEIEKAREKKAIKDSLGKGDIPIPKSAEVEV